MKKSNKKSNKILLISICLLLFIVGIIGGTTFSKYFAKIDGIGTAEIARWSFTANNETTTISNIQLNNTYNQDKLANNKIAPGTHGSFDIVLDVTGSDVAIDYEIIFDNLSNKPANLKFSYDGTTKDSLEDLESLLKGRITLNDSRTKTITINWSWEYQTGTLEDEILRNDKIDTQDSGKDFTFDIIITGTQVNPNEV